MHMFASLERKELLTDHLCTIIEQVLVPVLHNAHVRQPREKGDAHRPYLHHYRAGTGTGTVPVLHMFASLERKELLTDHLCTIIDQVLVLVLYRYCTCSPA
jgi:hypothetical protein